MSNGKGDTYRKVDRAKWEQGYARAFGKRNKPKRNESNRKVQRR